MAADREKSDVVLAFLALDDAKQSSVDDYRKSLIKVIGSDKDIEDLQKGDNSLSFTHNGNFCALGYIPAPIPWTDLEGPCETAWWWKGATKAMKGHKTHILATVMGDKGSRLERTVALTKYIAAAADCHTSAGIYWGDGTIVHEPSRFIKTAQSITTEDFPSTLWVNIRFWKTKDGKTSFATTGLEPFGKLEVEVVDSDADVNKVYDLVSGAVFLQLRGGVFKDGDTIGPDDATKVRTSHEKSIWDRPGKVLRIHY